METIHIPQGTVLSASSIEYYCAKCQERPAEWIKHSMDTGKSIALCIECKDK